MNYRFQQEYGRRRLLYIVLAELWQCFHPSLSKIHVRVNRNSNFNFADGAKESFLGRGVTDTQHKVDIATEMSFLNLEDVRNSVLLYMRERLQMRILPFPLSNHILSGP